MQNYIDEYKNSSIVREKRREFKEFCKENKDKELRRELANEIWEDYMPIKQSAYIKYHDDFTSLKIDATNARNNHYVAKSKPNFSLRSYNLKLKTNVSLGLLLGVLIFTVIYSTIWILILTNTLPPDSFFGFFLSEFIPISILVLIDLLIITIGVSGYQYIENNDITINRESHKLKSTISNFKRIYGNSENRFKNGNIKWTKFEKSINNWYKAHVISAMENPYEIKQDKVVPVYSNNFLTSGGIYCWIYQDKVIYIGKANNFKRRMKEHTAGLDGIGDHNERKYNVGLSSYDIDIKILAITNDEDEQSVLESFYFEKYKHNTLLNSTGTLSWKKIMMREKYREAWDRVKDSVL